MVAQLKMNMERSLRVFESVPTPKETTAARLKFDDDCVEKCYNVLSTWTSMFVDSHGIMSLSSGVNASQDVQQDLLRAKAVGQEKSSTFIEERIKHGHVPFHDPIRKNNLKTFSLNLKKSVKIRDKNVVIKADRDFFGRMLLLQERRGKCNRIYFFVVV